jgi:hypothetical protein
MKTFCLPFPFPKTGTGKLRSLLQKVIRTAAPFTDTGTYEGLFTVDSINEKEIAKKNSEWFLFIMCHVHPSSHSRNVK